MADYGHTLNKFSYKHYPEKLLRNFTDSIVSRYILDKSDVINYEEEKIISFQKYVEKNKTIDKVQNTNIADLNTLLKDQKTDSVSGRKISQDSILGSAKMDNLKAAYLIYATGIKKRNNDKPLLLNNRKQVIAQLDHLFSTNKNSSNESVLLLQKNINPNLDDLMIFPLVVSKHEVDGAPEIYELFSNDIIAFDMNTGMGAGRYAITYKVSGDHIIPFSVFPVELSGDKYAVKKAFKNKLTKYIKGNFSFKCRTGYEISKDKSGVYFVFTSFYKTKDPDCCPSMAVKYKTKDFKIFAPLQVQKDIEKDKWLMIK